MEGETLSSRPLEVKAEAPVDPPGDRLAKVTFETISNTLPKVKVKAPVDALAEVLAEVEPETLNEDWPMSMLWLTR